MTNKVEMILSAKDAQMVAAWKRGQQSVAAFNQELDKVGRKQARNKQQSGQFFNGMAAGLTRMVGGYVSVAAAAGVLMQRNREILTQTEEISKKYDEIFRKLRVQSGLRGLEGEEAQKRVLEIAERQGFTSEQAGVAATQLVSSGFSSGEATGGSLEEFLRILNASNITGKEVEPAELAKALASYLQSQGLEKNAENVALVGRKVQALFRGTNLQLPDLTELSKVSSIFKGMLTVEDQLGGMSTLVDQIPAAEAKTGFRNFVLRLSTVTEDQEPKLEALKQLGLEKDDVDFVGESFTEILDRLAVGIERVPEKDRKGVLNQIFGEKTIAAAEALINDRQKVKDSFPIQNNTQQFLEDVDEATSGRNAAERREQVRLERRRIEQDDQGDLLKKELDEMAEAAGMNRLSHGLKSGAFNAMRWLGFGAETAASFSYGGPSDFFTDESITDRAKRQLQDRQAPASEYGTGETAPPTVPESKSWWNLDSFNLSTFDTGTHNTKRKTPSNTATFNTGTFSSGTMFQEGNYDAGSMSTGNYNPGNYQQGETKSYDRGVDRFFGIQRQTIEKHTKALEDNTAALKAQNEKPVVAQKPIQVEVKMTTDTSTAPTGPRPTASLARPAK